MGKNEPKSGVGFSLQMWLVRFLGKKKKSGGEEEDGLCYKTSVLCSLLTHSKKGKILKETKKLACKSLIAGSKAERVQRAKQPVW